MRCALCQGRVSEVLDFGDVALAGAFLKPEDFASERKYRLRLAYCEPCLLLQVPDRVDSSTLFRDYFYFTSATETMRRHFAALASEIVEMYRPHRVVEIGCNDGALLKHLAAKVPHVVGVDPARNVVASIDDRRIEVINEFFGPGVVSGKANVVVANNVFAHMPDLHGVTQAVADLLTENGVFIFEVNRLDSMVADLQYDWVYHEHLFYYSLLALEKHLARHGLEIFDCKRIGTHAGSMRYYASKTGRQGPSSAVLSHRAMELWHNLHRIERFQSFADEAKHHREDMQYLVGQHGKVAGYGACGRTNTMLQFCGLDHHDIEYIVDDAPAKHGFYTPGSHIPVTDRARLDEDPPDSLIVFAWSFLQEIQPKLTSFDGRVVVPLPHIFEQQKERNAA